jgi:hypothetical protein
MVANTFRALGPRGVGTSIVRSRVASELRADSPTPPSRRTPGGRSLVRPTLAMSWNIFRGWLCRSSL